MAATALAWYVALDKVSYYLHEVRSVNARLYCCLFPYFGDLNCFSVIYLPDAFTLWFQLEDMYQLIVTPQGIEKVMIQLKDTPTRVYAIGTELFLSKMPLEVLQN